MAGGALKGSYSARVALRVLAGALFAYAGYLKATDPATFAMELQNYRLLPPVLVGLVASYVPWLELTCALNLFAATWRRGAWLLLTGLSIGFVVFVASARVRGLDIACGCFGGGATRTIDAMTIMRTVAVLGLSIAGFWLDRAPPQPAATR